MKITLTTPPYPFGWDSPPLGIMYIAAVLKNAGHEVKIVNLNKDKNYLYFAKSVLESDILGIGLTSQLASSGRVVILKAKKINPKIKIIAGGPHVSIFERNIFKQLSFIDYACIGEGEEIMLELASGEKLKDIKGLIWKDKGKIYFNQKRELVEDLDLLPQPSRDLINLSDYGEKGTIMTSRGCPFRCIYCFKLSGQTYRAHSPKYVISEMEKMRFEYGIRNYVIADDNFLSDVSRANEIIDCLIEKKWQDITIDLSNGIRIDSVIKNQALIKKMAKAGLRSVSLGVESVIPEVLEAAKKDIKVEQISEAIAILKKINLDYFLYFQVGLPKDKPEYLEKTKRWILANNITNFGVALTTPYPKTKLWNYVKKRGKFLFSSKDILRHYPWHNMVNVYPIWETKEFNAQERMRALTELRYFSAVRLISGKNIGKIILLLKHPALVEWVVKWFQYSVWNRFLNYFRKVDDSFYRN